jgi:hypothetical protein
VLLREVYDAALFKIQIKLWILKEILTLNFGRNSALISNQSFRSPFRRVVLTFAVLMPFLFIFLRRGNARKNDTAGLRDRLSDNRHTGVRTVWTSFEGILERRLVAGQGPE